MDRTHFPFIDWMKSLGMLLIVFGHVAGGSIEQFTPPIYPKQLGVAFFVFIIGWGLARESRDRLRVVYNRLFPVFFLGISFALVMSLILFVTSRHLNGSNYLPFLLGVNVLFDNFPANPTTWYIGTYIHIIILWALVLYRLRVRMWMVAAAAAIEILYRAAMLDTGALYRTYMMLPNWITVFLFGMFMHDRTQENSRVPLLIYALSLVCLVMAWDLNARSVAFDAAFPFRNSITITGWDGLLMRAASVTFLYVVYTWLVFEITRRLQESAIVGFFARHTLFIFVAHMPILFALQQFLPKVIFNYWYRVAISVLILYVGLAFVSEWIIRKLQLGMVRDTLWRLIQADRSLTQVIKA
jgi:peptidoglycan/LPS O-acetylase OafA/YrhL